LRERDASVWPAQSCSRPMRSWKRSRSATYPPGSGGCSADPGAPAGKERTVSFGVGSVTARFLWRLGNAPA